MNRRLAREHVFTLLFETAFHKDRDPEEILDTAKTTREWGNDAYVRDAYLGTLSHKEELDALIAENSHGWKKERISPVALAVMELAAYEMLYRKDIPVRVSLNEALEIVKSFDDEGARAFVNGILNAIAAGAKADRHDED